MGIVNNKEQEINERIRELAKQAGFQYIKDEGIGWAGNHNASLPKFAELIVRECIREVEGLEIVVEDGHEQWNRAVAHAGLHLRDHFGVEE